MKGQTDLEWFLSFGETLFERSPSGATLELLRSRAYALHPCTRNGCRNGILEEVSEGSKYHVGDDCPRCKGTGNIEVRLTATRSRQSSVTARPTTPAGQGGRRGIDDDRLTLYAAVSRHLWRLPRRTSEALSQAYGDAGTACAESARGRHWAVLPLTSAGSRLLEEHLSRHPEIGGSQHPLQTLSEIFALDKLKPFAKRSPLIHQAMQQAEALLQDAERAWELSYGPELEARRDAG